MIQQRKRKIGLAALPAVLAFAAACNLQGPADKLDGSANILGVLTAAQALQMDSTMASFFMDGMSGKSHGMMGSGAMQYIGNLASGTNTKQIVHNCPLGGTVTVDLSQDITQDVFTNTYNKSYTLNNGSRTFTYSSCSMNDRMTIVSGSMTVTQSGSAVWNSATPNAATDQGTIITDTLSGVQMNIRGTMKMQMSGSGPMNGPMMGGNQTIQAEMNLTASITDRVVEWTIDGSSLPSSPNLISKSGSMTGTVTVNGITRTISKTF